jgi:hypothetical protein
MAPILILPPLEALNAAGATLTDQVAGDVSTERAINGD